MRHFNFSVDRSDYLRRTKPTLPDDMRRLIDEAVASGRITHVPRGVSGLPQYRFVGIEAAPRSGGFMLVYTDPATGAESVVPMEQAKDKAQAKRKAGTTNLRAANEEKKKRAAARKVAILELHKAGQTVEQIAEAQGTTVAAIKELLKLIRREQRAQGLLPAYVPTGKPEALA